MDSSVIIADPPKGFEDIFDTIFSDDFKIFLVEIVRKFDRKIDEIFVERSKRRILLDERELKENDESLESLAQFMEDNFTNRPKEANWRVAEMPRRLKNRHLDLGDVSPADTLRFEHCLTIDPDKVQGIQVDFDDGHCPTWRNQLTGWHNIYKVVAVEQKPLLDRRPILMLRPRAWNMTDHSVMVDGKQVAGALLDFAVLIYHCGNSLAQSGATFEDRSGPFFYLSKLEGSNEARLWADMFDWSEKELGLAHGTIKACILIENIIASFDMENILYEIRDFAIGLNCGIWDYSASIINKFGKRSNFVIPDRKKYVNMEREFLKNYLKKVVTVCHKHGALATGGMASHLIEEDEVKAGILESVCAAKLKEIESGVDGFLVYDTQLVDPLHQLWSKPVKTGSAEAEPDISGSSLLKIPTGGATIEGLEHNVAVGILFIHSWISEGRGCFHYKGFVEDSATAEISRYNERAVKLFLTDQKFSFQFDGLLTNDLPNQSPTNPFYLEWNERLIL